MKEEMFKAEMLNQQLTQMEEHLQQVDMQHKDTVEIQQSLEDFKKLKQGDELLVSLAPGIFVKAAFAGSQELLVNVGMGVTVPQSPDEVQSHIQEQLDSMEAYQQELHAKFSNLLGELDKLKDQFKE